MKSICFTICVVAAVATLCWAQPKSFEPKKPRAPAADRLIGKKAGQERDDNGLKMKLVWCPPGEFTMGSPLSEQGHRDDEHQVEVTLTIGFWLGKYEVTQSEWKRVMRTEPWKGRESTKEGAEYPATHVSSNDAVNFCRKLTEQEHQAGRLPKDWEYTLPTEAQWERACRAGTKTKFSYGDDESKLGDYAWFDGNTSKADEQYAHRVGQKKSNPWGLHDMHGNVLEWCRDRFHVLPGGRDPEVIADGGGLDRVSRGGHWCSPAAFCRSASRNWYAAELQHHGLGFRVALSTTGNK